MGYEVGKISQQASRNFFGNFFFYEDFFLVFYRFCSIIWSRSFKLFFF